MNEDPNKSFDALGLKPVAESVRIATQGTIDGAAAFLRRICLPAAEEFGFLLRDKVAFWRTQNLVKMAKRAEQLLEGKDLHGHPRIVSRIVEESSWTEDSHVQDMWAGLLASACSEPGDDDSNLIFIDLLSRLSRMQCLIVDYSCRNARMFLTPNNLPFSRPLDVPLQHLHEITQCEDLERIDRELDNLRDLGLLKANAGFLISDNKQEYIDIAPSPLAIYLHIRCQGSRESPAKYHSLKVEPFRENEPKTNSTIAG